MPLHRIYHPEGYYTEEEKASLSKRITQLYSDGRSQLPKFYVVAVFIPVPSASFYVGGESRSDFVRIAIEHIARQFGDDITKKLTFMEAVEKVYDPYTKGKGADWEISVDVTDWDTWHINGLAPPKPYTEAEKLWRGQNKAIPY